jgi:hypothetical protein
VLGTRWKGRAHGAIGEARGDGAVVGGGGGGRARARAIVATAIGAGPIVAAAIVVAAAAGWARGRRGLVGRLGVELVELADDVAGFGELSEVDLASADEIEDELAEVGQGVLAAAVGACVVEPRATFAGASLEGVADDAGGGPEQGTEGAA